MTLEALKEAKEIEEKLNRLNQRLKHLYDPSKIDQDKVNNFKIKSGEVELKAQYEEKHSYRYDTLKIDISAEMATYLWHTHLNLIRGRIHQLKSKLSKL